MFRINLTDFNVVVVRRGSYCCHLCRHRRHHHHHHHHGGFFPVAHAKPKELDEQWKLFCLRAITFRRFVTKSSDANIFKQLCANFLFYSCHTDSLNCKAAAVRKRFRRLFSAVDETKSNFIVIFDFEVWHWVLCVYNHQITMHLYKFPPHKDSNRSWTFACHFSLTRIEKDGVNDIENGIYEISFVRRTVIRSGCLHR